MDDAICKRCGTCCLAGGFSLIKDVDIQRWEREGRCDILHIITKREPVWAGDRLISAGMGEMGNACPFLIKDGGIYVCTIYESRPVVCRDFMPGSSRICPQWKDKSRE